MVRYDSLSHIFGYAWDHVVTCYWKKYPNEFSTHVLSEDVIERRLLDGNRLYTKRMMSKTNPLPKWGTTIFPSHMTKVAHVLEETIVDPLNYTMVSYTWNITYRSLMDIREKITLSRGSDHTTTCDKEGWADSSATGLRRVLRKFGITRWRANASKACRGYEHTLAKFFPDMVRVDETANELKVPSLPKLKENAFETIKDAKDKAKHKALDLAARAAVKQAKETGNLT